MGGVSRFLAGLIHRHTEREMIPMVDGDSPRKIENDFPGWKVAKSEVAWSATRDHVLTGADMTAGLRHQLAADTPQGLRAALGAQKRVEALVNEAKRTLGPAASASWNPAYL